MSNQNTNEAKDKHRKTVGEWLGQNIEWRIPVYQRHYAWDADDEFGPIHLFWDTVKNQVRARLEEDKPISPHYLGAVLVDNKTHRQSTDDMRHFDVVDGQQRLTTIQIAMLALTQVAKNHGCGDEIKEALENYVFADKAKKLPRLHPTNFDNEQFRAVLNHTYKILMNFGLQNADEERVGRSKIVSAFNFFKAEQTSLVGNHPQSEAKSVVHAIMKTLTQGFDLVLIVLRPSDNAQLIFESLNNYAKPLTTFDLIRNNVFHRAASIRPGMDEELFDTSSWQQLEGPYWEGKADNQKVNWTTHIEAYVARMLVTKMRKGILFNRNSIFRTYKEFCEGFSSIDEEIGSLVDYVDVYQYLDADMGRNPAGDDVDFGVFRHAVWKNRDFYPALFLIARCGADAEQKRRMLMLLESYVVRRGVCGLPSGHYNKHAVTICAALGNNPDYEALNSVLKNPEAETTIFPSNEMVMNGSVANGKFLKVGFARYVLEKIETSLHTPQAERVIGDLTLDHILPKKWEKNDTWRSIVLESVAENPEFAVMEANQRLDTIGNLTLLSARNNTAKSNRPLQEVKKLFSESTVKMNRDLAKEEKWNVERIEARSRNLAEKICEIWKYDVA